MGLIFPATSTLYEGKNVTPERFDEIFNSTVKEGGEGFFILSGKEDAYLFTVSGRPYASGRIGKDGPVLLDVREFFDAFRKMGSGDMVFYKAERKLLQSILVYFSKDPSKKFTPDMVDMEKVLNNLEIEGANCIIATKGGGKIGFSICLSGKISFNYLPGNQFSEEQPREALMLYIFNFKESPLTIEVFDDIRLSPASDAIPPKSELPKSLITHYLKPPSVSVAGAEVILTLNNKVIGRYSITRPETTIGRIAGSDIPIENPGVSRRHAVIKEEAGNFIIEDMGSSNGTFLNGEKITARELKDGDQIQILKYVLQFKYKAAATAEEELAAEKTMYIEPSALKAKKEVKLLLEDGKEVPLRSAVLTIGSGKNVDLRLEGLLIGGLQASITLGREGKAMLVHKGSFFTATKVNGKSIDQHILQNNDIIEIGKYKIKYLVS